MSNNETTSLQKLRETQKKCGRINEWLEEELSSYGYENVPVTKNDLPTDAICLPNTITYLVQEPPEGSPYPADFTHVEVVLAHVQSLHYAWKKTDMKRPLYITGYKDRMALKRTTDEWIEILYGLRRTCIAAALQRQMKEADAMLESMSGHAEENEPSIDLCSKEIDELYGIISLYPIKPALPPHRMSGLETADITYAIIENDYGSWRRNKG